MYVVGAAKLLNTGEKKLVTKYEVSNFQQPFLNHISSSSFTTFFTSGSLLSLK